MDKEIGRIKKGEYQGTVTDIVVGIKEFNGRIGVDIREFTQSESYTGPTKKGLRIPAESFEEFQRMISLIKPEELQAKQAPTKESSTIDDDNTGINEEDLM